MSLLYVNKGIRKGICLVTAMLSMFVVAHAQAKKRDSLMVLSEYVKLWQLYQQNVRLRLHIQNTASHITKATDTMQANMDYYISSHNFYMQAEGLEEIVNDSMILLINHPVKRMMLYSNNQPVQKSIERTVAAFMPDSSVENLSRTYLSEKLDAGKNHKRIQLTSRANVFGTAIPKETISVLYKEMVYEPEELIQTKASLIPIDTLAYTELVKRRLPNGRLVVHESEKGRLFFLVKELTTAIRFNKIIDQALEPPVQLRERIVINENGAYTPAKGFEDYLLSKEL